MRTAIGHSRANGQPDGASAQERRESPIDGLERPAVAKAALAACEPGDESGAEYLPLLESSAADVHRFVGQRVANHADAADLAQEALLLACAKLSTFRGENFRAWIFTIARHLIVDYYRAQHRHEFVDVTPAGLAETQHALQTDPEAVQLICECRDRVRCWMDCVSHWLRLEEQVAVLLADVHGYRDRDSAAALNLSVPSFKLLLHQARERLHQVSGGGCTLARSACAAANTSVASPAKTGGGNGRSNGGSTVNLNYKLLDQQNGPLNNGTRARADETGALNAAGAGSRVPSCPSGTCRLGEVCRLGIKCCRQVPKLLALRGELLDALRGSSLFQLLLLLPGSGLGPYSDLFDTAQLVIDLMEML